MRAEIGGRGDAAGEAATGGAAAREDLVGPRDPHDDRLAAASPRRLRPEGRQARRQDPDPQLRARRRRHVAVVGHGQHGRRPGRAAPGPPSRRPRRRGRRPDHRARAAAAWLRRHDLRRGRAAGPVTSNWSLAGFTPTSGLSTAAGRTPEWTAQFQQAVDIAYRRLQLLDWTAIWHQLDHQLLTHRRRADGVGHQLAAAGAHPGREAPARARASIPSRRSSRSSDPRCASSRPSTSRRCSPTSRCSAAPSSCASSRHRREIAALPENVVVNCTGLGAKALFGDPDLIPLKGQLTVLVAQPEIQDLDQRRRAASRPRSPASAST